MGSARGPGGLRSAVAAALLTLVVLTVAAAAFAASPPDLVQGYLFAKGKLAPLHANVTYQASKLPIPFRVTLPSAGWGGTQWKANDWAPDEIAKRHLHCPLVCKPPYFGWAVIGQPPQRAGVPHGIVLVLAGYSHTPGVAATVTSLLTRGHGFTTAATSRVKVGGFRGVQFDGQIVAAEHTFIPFSPRTHAAKSFPDGIAEHGAGHGFRFVVLDVRGKTVVIFIGTEALDSTRFAAFLDDAMTVVGSFRFPAG